MSRIETKSKKVDEKDDVLTMNNEEQDASDDVVFVEEFKEDDDISELEHLRKLFVGGLAPYTTEKSLKAYYQKWGKVVDVIVMRDTATKRSRGFGFVTYTKAFMVDKAQNNRPHIIDGKAVEAKRALARPEREERESNVSVKKLFVGGLKDNHDEECLKDYFSEFGKVVSVKILIDKNSGKRRGFAFIEYDDYDAVDKAVLKTHHLIKYVVVDVKKSIYEGQEKQNRQTTGTSSNKSQIHNHFKGGPANSNQPLQPAYGMPASLPRQHVPAPVYNGPPPPQNYNYWGPPSQQPPQPQYYGGGYLQPPSAPQMGNWGYPAPPQNQWNAYPPGPPIQPGLHAPPSNANWQQPPGQWGPPPVAGPPAGGPPPAPAWNAALPSLRPNGPPGVGSSMVPPSASNFGSGYQQNYGGGPSKNANLASNRLNPYGALPRYGHPGPAAAPSGPPGVGEPPGNNNARPGLKPIPPVGKRGY